MACILCGKRKTIELQQGDLCRSCFVQYFQKKVFKTIRKHRLFRKTDSVCFSCSGGKSSLSALHLVKKITDQRKQRLAAVGIDEGTPGHGKQSMKAFRDFCSASGIEHEVLSFRRRFGKGSGKIIYEARSKGVDASPCSICAALRNLMVREFARGRKLTVIMTGENLDSIARRFMSSLFSGDLSGIFSMGPVFRGSGKEIPLSRPLFMCTEEECSLYAKLMRFASFDKPCAHLKGSMDEIVARKLDEMERMYTGTKTSIIRNMMGLSSSVAGSGKGFGKPALSPDKNILSALDVK